MSTQYEEIINRLKDLKNSNGKSDIPNIPLIDPTANVLLLVTAETRRHDDLRAAEGRRQDDLRNKTDHCAHEIREIEKKAQQELSRAEAEWRNAKDLAESLRIDSNMATQQQNARFETEKLSNTAVTLAGQVASTAEAMRASSAVSAQQTADLIGVLRDSHDKRITELEQNRYQIGGRDIQRTEGRTINQWVIGLLISMPSTIIAVILILKLLK